MKYGICPRHFRSTNRVVDGVPYCYHCFREAIIEAEAVALEKEVGPIIRAFTVTEVLRRLEGRP